MGHRTIYRRWPFSSFSVRVYELLNKALTGSGRGRDQARQHASVGGPVGLEPTVAGEVYTRIKTKPHVRISEKASRHYLISN